MPPKLSIYSYARCATCRKAISWLEANSISYELEDIVKNPPPKAILAKAISQIDNRKRLFNTSGISYRSLGADRVKAMTDDEALDALCSDGKLIKRPLIVIENDKILIGFKSEVWAEALLG